MKSVISSHPLFLSDILSFLLSTKNNKISHMKHFKLNIETEFVPVADLCIDQLPAEDYATVIKTFAHALVDCHIAFDIIENENQILVAKKKTTSWSITE